MRACSPMDVPHSPSSAFGEVALIRNLLAAGSAIPCAQHATFFSVSVSGCPDTFFGETSESVRSAKPTVPTPEEPQLVQDLATDADQGDDPTQRLVQDLATHADQGDQSTAELVRCLLNFLWFAGNSRVSSTNAMQESSQRLAKILQEIKRARQLYGGLTLWQDTEANERHAFTDARTAKIHNTYQDSLTWMNTDIRHKYDAIPWKQNPHKQVKGWFFNQIWGSKAFFMHLVRFGTKGDIAAMLGIFRKFKASSEYWGIVQANEEKSADERKTKLKRNKLKQLVTLVPPR
jgi:hypothetical protein